MFAAYVQLRLPGGGGDNGGTYRCTHCSSHYLISDYTNVRHDVVSRGNVIICCCYLLEIHVSSVHAVYQCLTNASDIFFHRIRLFEIICLELLLDNMHIANYDMKL